MKVLSVVGRPGEYVIFQLRLCGGIKAQEDRDEPVAEVDH